MPADRPWHKVGCALLALFVGIVALEHLLVPQLSPASHMISEYADGGAGAGTLMVIGFLCWSTALGITAAVVHGSLSVVRRGVARTYLVWFLGVASVAILVTACFRTQTTAGVLPAGTHWTASGRLHDVGSGVATLALLGGAVASTRAIPSPPMFRRWALRALVAAVGLDVVLLALGPAVGGVRQRSLIVIVCTWQAAILFLCGTPGAPVSDTMRDARADADVQ